ncbi:MAG: FAD-binding protein [Gammaproteobacteria bacterium]
MTSNALRASRRRFIASAAPAVGLAACGVKPDAPLDVVVVGAGLAGLAAALELEKVGFHVQVIASEPQVLRLRSDWITARRWERSSASSIRHTSILSVAQDSR